MTAYGCGFNRSGRPRALVKVDANTSRVISGLMQAVRYNVDRVTFLCSSNSFASAHNRRRARNCSTDSQAWSNAARQRGSFESCFSKRAWTCRSRPTLVREIQTGLPGRERSRCAQHNTCSASFESIAVNLPALPGRPAWRFPFFAMQFESQAWSHRYSQA